MNIVISEPSNYASLLAAVLSYRNCNDRTNPDKSNDSLAALNVDPTPPTVKRRYPRPRSVRGRILGALLRGNALTQQDSQRIYQEIRLAAQIHKLREYGWDIVSEVIRVATKDGGRFAKVARYFMPRDERSAVGVVGKAYAELSRGAA